MKIEIVKLIEFDGEDINGEGRKWGERDDTEFQKS